MFTVFAFSFKERGARYTLKMLNSEQRSRGVVAASAGNHALALAYHGQTLNVPVTVVMPIIAPMMKVELCRSFNATVIVQGACWCLLAAELPCVCFLFLSAFMTAYAIFGKACAFIIIDIVDGLNYMYLRNVVTIIKNIFCETPHSKNKQFHKV